MTIENNLGMMWMSATCGDLIRAEWPVTVVDASMPIEQAYDVLVQNGIHAAPILDRASGAVTGMLDLSDICVYLTAVFTASGNDVRNEQDSTSAIGDILHRVHACQKVPVRLVSGKNKFLFALI